MRGLGREGARGRSEPSRLRREGRGSGRPGIAGWLLSTKHGWERTEDGTNQRKVLVLGVFICVRSVYYFSLIMIPRLKTHDLQDQLVSDVEVIICLKHS